MKHSYPRKRNAIKQLQELALMDILHSNLQHQQVCTGTSCYEVGVIKTSAQQRGTLDSPLTAAVLLAKVQRATAKPSFAGLHPVTPRFSTAVTPAPTRPTAPPEDGTSSEVPAAGGSSSAWRAVYVPLCIALNAIKTMLAPIAEKH
jgi:hypothetical protein